MKCLKCLYRLNYLIKRFISLFLCFCVCLLCVYTAPCEIYASATDASGMMTQIFNYFLSTAGAGSMDSNTGIFGKINQENDQKWSDFIERCRNASGTEYWVDEQGNYNFSEGITQSFYEALLSDSSIDARVISDFNGASFSTVLDCCVSQYTNNSFNTAIYNACQRYEEYLIIGGIGYDSNFGRGWNATARVIDLSDLAYFVIGSSGNTITFRPYNKQGAIISIPFTAIWQEYNRGSFYDVCSRTSSSNYFAMSLTYDSRNYEMHNTEMCDSVFAPSADIQLSGANHYLLAPFYSPKGGLMFSNRSLIIAKNSASGSNLYQGSDGVQVNNTYTSFPKISQKAFEENNWQNIYNNYVTNVNDYKSEYYNADSGKVDYNKLRDYMRGFTSSITQSISSGVTNIEEQVSVTNDWLKKIYKILKEIRALLNESGSGSSVDLTNIETYLDSIDLSLSDLKQSLVRVEGGLSDTTDKLEANYTVLSNILLALNDISSSNGSPYIVPDSDPWEPWFDALDSIPSDEVLEYVSKFDVVESLLRSSVPFCYFTALGVLVSSFESDPIEPDFSIPVVMSQNADISEEIGVNVTIMDDILPLLHGGILILFIIGLIWAFVWLLAKLLDIFEI